MAAAGVPYNGLTPILFASKGAKIDRFECRKMLQDHYVPQRLILFPDGDFAFQEDGASSHREKRNQKWLDDNFPKLLDQFAQ